MKDKKNIIIVVLIVIVLVAIGIIIFLLNKNSLTDNKSNSTTSNSITNHTMSFEEFREYNTTTTTTIEYEEFSYKRTTEETTKKTINYEDYTVPTRTTTTINYGSRLEEIDATIEYYCTGNFVVVGNECHQLFVMDSLKKYACSKGTLNSKNECEYNTTIDVPITQLSKEICYEAIGAYGGAYNSCVCSKSGGIYDSRNNRCYKNGTATVKPDVEMYCTGDLVLDDNKCKKLYKTGALFRYTCPDGYTLSSNKCIK